MLPPPHPVLFVYVCDREMVREREGGREGEGEKAGERVCVRERVNVRDGGRERERKRERSPATVASSQREVSETKDARAPFRAIQGASSRREANLLIAAATSPGIVCAEREKKSV